MLYNKRMLYSEEDRLLCYIKTDLSCLRKEIRYGKQSEGIWTSHSPHTHCLSAGVTGDITHLRHHPLDYRQWLLFDGRFLDDYGRSDWWPACRPLRPDRLAGDSGGHTRQNGRF